MGMNPNGSGPAGGGCCTMVAKVGSKVLRLKLGVDGEAAVDDAAAAAHGGAVCGC